MAKSARSTGSAPLSVVKDDAEIEKEAGETLDKAKQGVNHMSQDISSQIESLREELATLKESMSDLSGRASGMTTRAGRAVADGASAATARVSSTVETYPLSTVFVVSALAFVAGRFTASQTSASTSQRALDHLWSGFNDLSARVQPYIKEARHAIR